MWIFDARLTINVFCPLCSCDIINSNSIKPICEEEIMQKVSLNPDQYLAELNRQLQQHENYSDGMAFMPYPEGSTGSGMSGYSINGPFNLTGIYAQVAHQVSLKFTL
jgi:hypothetical protein